MRRAILMTATTLAALTLFACGSEPATEAPAEPAKTAEPAKAEPTKAEPAKAAKGGKNAKGGKGAKGGDAAASIVTYEGDVAIIALEGTDAMKFNAKRIEVKAGSKIKLTLTHTGSMPAAAMGHNFVLLKPGTDIAAFANAAIAAVADSYIPGDQKDAVIANTTVVGGGESVTIEFDAPAAGEYDFLCSFPGHYAVMQGKFVVVEG